MVLNMEILLGHVKRYIFDLVDIDNHKRSMPMFYRIKRRASAEKVEQSEK